jgi:glucosamine-6-phosphate deaminase
MEVIIQSNAESAARTVVDSIAQTLLARPASVLGLATGLTMESVYDQLVRKHQAEGLDFSQCQTFNLDEYVGLAADDPCSYHYFMRQRFFDRVNIQLQNTHLPDGMAENLEAECANYEKLISDVGGIDLQVLGIGLNGHLGFNEPLSSFQSRTQVQTLSRVTRQQNTILFPKPKQMPSQAITMGIGTILEARRCLLLATGLEKAEIVAKAIEGPLTAMVTASALQLHPHCTVVLDEAAASRLQEYDHYKEMHLRKINHSNLPNHSEAKQNRSQLPVNPIIHSVEAGKS